MDKEDFINSCKYISLLFVLCVFSYASMKLVADGVSDYKIIKPKEGVECVVVSRMFNTSVDCWRELPNE